MATTAHPWVADGQAGLRFGIVGGPPGDWPRLRDFVQTVEGLGFDSYWRSDHPLLTPDCWTMLAAIATTTQRLRLGSLVSCVYYRNPVLLARIVADVDRLSGGRVILGLGAGDVEREFHGMALRYPPVSERHAALAETLQVVPRLLRGETVAISDGNRPPMEEVTLQPAAAQQPYVPLLVAGGGHLTLRLAAEFADASNIAGERWGGAAAKDTDVRLKYEELRAHCAAAARPYDSVLRTYHFVPTLLAESQAALSVKRERVPPHVLAMAGAAAVVGTPEQALQRLEPLAAAGCQYFTFAVFDTETLALLAERVIPRLVQRD